MSGKDTHRHLSQLVVERYLHDELDRPACARIEAAMADCELCNARVQDTRAEEEAFKLRPVPEEIRALWTAPPRPSWRRAVFVGVPSAAAAALVVVLVYSVIGNRTRSEYVWQFDDRARREEVRIKGPAEITEFDAAIGAPEPVSALPLNLGFYVLDDGKEKMGRPGHKLKSGDRIQFWYDAPANGAAVIVGIDGHRQVTRYFPAGPATSGQIQSGKGHLIKSSVILDDTPGVERFYLCFGQGAKDPAAVEQAARRIAGEDAGSVQPARLPVECAQTSIWIEKD